MVLFLYGQAAEGRGLLLVFDLVSGFCAGVFVFVDVWAAVVGLYEICIEYGVVHRAKVDETFIQ